VAHCAEVAARGVADENDIASAATVTAVGTTVGNMCLAAEADHAVAAGAALYMDFCPIVKQCNLAGS